MNSNQELPISRGKKDSVLPMLDSGKRLILKLAVDNADMRR